MNFHVVLVEPEIPNNTGNIGRTCVATKSSLHLVEPLGFDISNKQLRRAGLDYWPHLTWKMYSSWQNCKKAISSPPDRIFYFSTKGQRSIYDSSFRKGDWFVFGKETKGLGDQMLKENREQTVALPMLGAVRSLNLANAVAITLYEGLRQIGYENTN